MTDRYSYESKIVPQLQDTSFLYLDIAIVPLNKVVSIEKILGGGCVVTMLSGRTYSTALTLETLADQLGLRR